MTRGQASSAVTLTGLRVVDSDSHVTEPADLWVSRLPGRWAAAAPHVAQAEGSATWRWKMGDTWLEPVGFYSHSGWHEYWPGCPPSLDEADPACFDGPARLAKMDEFGIYAQVLYPNLMAFNTWLFMEHPDEEFGLACVSAYNDFQSEFASADPKRLIPISVVPFWDIDAAVAEIRRCAGMGHRGLLWANKFEKSGLPSMTDPHWDPIYRLASELELSLNFHVGFAEMSTRSAEGLARKAALAPILSQNNERIGTVEDPPDQDVIVSRTRTGTIAGMMSNGEAIVTLVTSDLFERWPELKFVSVESGFGYVPFMLEFCDWSWSMNGGRHAFPGRPMPSEVFREHCYGSFWFEKVTLPMLEQFPHNFMYETDFPHPSSMTPGGVSVAEHPRESQQHILDTLTEPTARKVLSENAMELYHLE